MSCRRQLPKYLRFVDTVDLASGARANSAGDSIPVTVHMFRAAKPFSESEHVLAGFIA